MEVEEELVVGELSRSVRIMLHGNLVQVSRHADAPTRQQLVEYPSVARPEAMHQHVVRLLRGGMQEGVGTASCDLEHLHR